MAELAKAYVQIVPSAKGMGNKITEMMKGSAGGAGDAAGSLIGSDLVNTLKNVIKAAGIGKFIQESLEAGGDIQQSFGGLDTLYGDASTAMKQYAQEAYAVGLSANDYAEQATSFGASLKQAFEGDVVAAAESANQAITDMADNSAKFGTDIESIQNAYQGFAKQNYTMLDNLKLGYGGTKTEMERLLADANEINAQNGIITDYSIDNLGDIYEAIHVVQDSLGVAGTAADEAGKTFTGSFSAMKAAATNLLASLTADELDVTPQMEALVSSASNFLFGNLLPMLGRMVTSIPEALGAGIETAIPILQTQLGNMLDSAFSFLESGGMQSAIASGISTANNYINGILESLPQITASGIRLLSDLVSGITSSLPMLISEGSAIVNALVNYVIANAPMLVTSGLSLIAQLAAGIVANLPTLLTNAAQIVTNICSGIAINLPQIATQAAGIISNIVANIVINLPQIIASGAQLVASLITGIGQAIPALVESAVICITGFIEGFATGFPSILSAGQELISNLVQGALSLVGDLLDLGSEVIDQIWAGMTGSAGEIDANQIVIDPITGQILAGSPEIMASAEYTGQAVAEGLSNAESEIVTSAEELASAGAETIANYDYSSAAATVGTSVATGIADEADAVSTATEGVASRAVAELSDVDCTTGGTAIVTSVASGVTGGSDTVTSATKTVATSAATSFTSVPWNQAGTQADTKISQGIRSYQAVVSSALRSVATSGKTAFSSVGWYSVGSNIIAGIKSGISGSSGSLYSQLRSVASSALAAAKAELNIESPSKRFRDEVGYYMMAGWAAGVSNNSGMLLDAVSSAADDTLSATGLEKYASRTNRSVTSTDNRVIELLEIIAAKDPSVTIGNRDFRRSLEDQGVKFA